MSTRPAALEDFRMPGLAPAALPLRAVLIAMQRLWCFPAKRVQATPFGRRPADGHSHWKVPLHWGMNS